MEYRFGPLVLDAEQRLLFHGELRVPLAPKTFDLLNLLLANAPEVVTRETLRELIWEGAHVDEAAVSRNVSLVRVKLRPYFGETEVVETISKRGYRFVIPVEAVAAKSSRSASPMTVQDEQISAADTAYLQTTDDPAPKASKPATRWVLAGATLVVILAAILGFSIYRSEHVHAQQDELAVLDFHDLSGTADASWMGVALEESLAQGLSRDGGMTALNPDLVAVAEEDLGLTHARKLEGAEFEQLEKRLGAHYLVTGTYMPLGDQVRVDLILHKGGKNFSEVSETVLKQDLQATVERAGAQMRAALHLPKAQTGGELQYFGANELATHFYAEGLRLSRNGDFPRQAREAFSKAVEADPKFAEAHEALATAWARVGHSAESRAEAQLALDTCGSLPETRRLSVQAAAYRQLRNYPKSLEAVTQLRKLHPEDQSYKLRMANALISSNELPEATALLREMEADKAHPPNLEALGYLMRVLSMQGDKNAQFLYPDKIMKLARAEGSRSAEAQAHLYAGRAWNGVGDGPKSVAEFQQAGVLSGEIGDTAGVIVALQNESATRTKFHMPGAIEVGQQALDKAVEAGQDGTVAEQCINLGSAALDASQLRSAVSYYNRAQELGGVIQSKHMQLIAMDALVNAYLESELLPAAEKEDAQELQSAQAIGTPVEMASATQQSAQIYSYLGKWDQAEAKFKDALAILQKAGAAADANELLVDYSWMLLSRGETARARHIFATVNRVTVQDNATQAAYEEARLALEAGDLTAAERLASAALVKDHIPHSNATGLDVLMEVAVRQKDAGKARSVAERYTALAQSIPEDGAVRRGAIYAAAQAEIAAGNRTGEAVKKLPQVLREASQLGHAAEVTRLQRLLGGSVQS